MSPIDLLVAGPQLPALMKALDQHFTVHRLWEMDDRAAFLREKGATIRAVVTSFIYGADAILLDSLPNLEIVASYGVGLDRLDLETLKRRGILLTNTPDINEPVADLAMSLLLAVTRRVCEGDRFVRAGEWPRKSFPFGVSLQGKTCGIVGLGRIGKSVAKRAEAFGMKIAYYGPHAKPEVAYEYFKDLKALAQASDFLVLALPGGPETRHVINAEVLAALGTTGFLINVARGSVVDEPALIQALKTGQIAGAGLDVFEREPLADSPLMAMENVVLLPHIASATDEMRHTMGEVVLDNLKAHFSGKPLHTPVPL
jgi:hydroxypyruvate reductase